MTYGQVALVTGGNKGLGLAIVRGLARRDPSLTVLLGSRDPARGHDAVEQLRADGLNNVQLIQLDVTDKNSIDNAKHVVESQFSELNILVNNAGIASQGPELNARIARDTIATNYYGVVEVTRQFWPLLVKGQGCVVNISSSISARALTFMSSERQARFLDDNLALNGLNALMEEFVEDVAQGDYRSKGWPANSYGVSKAGVSMFTRIMSRDHASEGVVINCVCPGWVKTDMTGPHALLSPDEGAITPLKLCTLKPGDPSGLFWYKELPTGWLCFDH